MSSAELVVKGKEEVIAGFDAVAKTAGDLTEPHRRILARLIPEIKSATPRRTGALGISWGGTATSTTASVESPLRYAPRMATTIERDILPATTDEMVKEYADALASSASAAGFGVSK